MKTAISIPDQIFQSAEVLAGHLGLSRSQLYTKAVEDFIKEHKSQYVTDALNRVYSAEDNSLEDGFHSLQVNSLDQEEW